MPTPKTPCIRSLTAVPPKKTAKPSKTPKRKQSVPQKVVRKKAVKSKAAKTKAQTKTKKVARKGAGKTRVARRSARTPSATIAAALASPPPPRITRQEYQRRRLRLMAMMEPGTIALIPAAKIAKRTRVTDYPFRQDSDFYYLTGFEEPDGVLVLTPDRQHGEVILFCAERDAHKEQWDGEILGPERAIEVLGLDDAFPRADMQDILPGLLEGKERIYITLGEYAAFDAQLMGWVQRMRTRESGAAIPPGEFVALKHLLHEMRLYKSAGEIRLMERAAQISASAHGRAMRACAPGQNESHLEAELIYEFMRQGARTPAYSSIVGAGSNACVMHYAANNAPLKRGDLVLVDAGAEYQYYASDITRTFPVSGKFNAAQQAVYEVVLNAQTEAINAARLGNHFDMPHQSALATLVQGLIDLRLLKGSVDGAIESGAYRSFCPSKTSHWLGIDVHDAGDYRVGGAWRELESSMVITVEPGIYIPADLPGIAAKWRGIGVRIEDEVLITRDGPRVLTSGAPKTAKDIHAMMRRKL